MLLLSVTLVTILIVGYSGKIVYKKRKNLTKDSDMKSWVTPICLHLAPVVALVTYAFDWAGGLGFFLLGVLFISAAYFSKYQPQT